MNGLFASVLGASGISAGSGSNRRGLDGACRPGTAVTAPRKRRLAHEIVGPVFGATALVLAPSNATAATAGQILNVAQLGDCMFRLHRSAALKLINADSVAASEDAVGALRDEKSCLARLPSNSELDGTLSNYSKGVIRGMIAEAALRATPKSSSLPSLPLRQKRYVRPWFPTTGRDLAVDEMSTCVADTDPHGVRELIATEPNSFGESYALGALQPWLVNCLSAGRRVEADRTALRAALADALYQRLRNPLLSEAPQQTPEASK